jgi:PHD/YefM family antitoxin component YafN of YafNO toxin-antitoxin module
VYTVVYTFEVVVPEVLSVREFRAGLAAALARVAEGSTVFVGAHRRPEVVVMSVEQYEALVRSAQLREAVAEALASVRAEGLEPTLDGLELLEAIASGRIEEDEAIAALWARHQR